MTTVAAHWRRLLEMAPTCKQRSSLKGRSKRGGVKAGKAVTILGIASSDLAPAFDKRCNTLV